MHILIYNHGEYKNVSFLCTLKLQKAHVIHSKITDTQIQKHLTIKMQTVKFTLHSSCRVT